MTAQVAERVIIESRPQRLHAQPLYRLEKHFRLKLSHPRIRTSSNWRGYVGTWEILNDRLYLVHLNWDCGREVPMSGTVRRKVLRAAAARSFPVHAHWYNGVVRIPVGRRLIYSHHGWSHWYERERVIRFVGGTVVRDREVDTRAILEWWLRRSAEAGEFLDPSTDRPVPPLTWYESETEDEEEKEWLANWWPPGYVRPAAAG